MLSVQETEVAIAFLKDEFAKVWRLGPFTGCEAQDVSVDLRDMSFAATSPRGAVFLGELAAVGFFGADAQTLLS